MISFHRLKLKPGFTSVEGLIPLTFGGVKDHVLREINHPSRTLLKPCEPVAKNLRQATNACSDDGKWFKKYKTSDAGSLSFETVHTTRPRS
jgi:hypothetical protein